MVTVACRQGWANIVDYIDYKQTKNRVIYHPSGLLGQRRISLGPWLVMEDRGDAFPG